MDELLQRLSSFISRKVAFGSAGLAAYAYLPIWFKNQGVSENVTLASLAGITLIVGYYFKVNVDSKVDGNP